MSIILNTSEDCVVTISMESNNRSPISIPYTELINSISEKILIEQDQYLFLNNRQKMLISDTPI